MPMSNKQANPIEIIGALRARSCRHNHRSAVRAEAGPLTGGPDPTRRAAERSGASTGIRRCVAVGPAGPPSCCGRGTVAVAVVTAQRAGTRRRKPRGASTRHIDTPAQPGERSERERSERPGEQDCRAGAMAQRTRLVWCGGRSW